MSEPVSLEERIGRIERRLALYDLIASYGPSVDSGSGASAAQLWSDDGVYDYGDSMLEGADAVAGMVRGPAHQGLIHQGAAHMLGFPAVRCNAECDQATVTGYSQVCRHEDGKFYLWRVSANSWECRWDGERWVVDRRRAYLLNGQERSRVLLREGIDGHA